MPDMRAASILLLCLLASSFVDDAQARTVHRCVRDGSVSLSTAPEPGSRCEAIVLDDAAAKVPNLWGAIGVKQGMLYRRMQDGVAVYGTRELPGAVPLHRFLVHTPAASPAHAGQGEVGPPRLDAFAAQFRASAQATGVDDAWLRAIAHAESGFDARATSPKGAQGVMQLMPATAAEYGVEDPYASSQSIRAGARHLQRLTMRYAGDLTLVAAAYNAGEGAVAKYGGVPPYAETQAYVAKVLALHQRYRDALAAAPAGGGRERAH
jgi:hypothetical protein